MVNTCPLQIIRDLESRKRLVGEIESWYLLDFFHSVCSETCTLSTGLIVILCLFALANATLRQTIDDGTEHT